MMSFKMECSSCHYKYTVEVEQGYWIESCPICGNQEDFHNYVKEIKECK